MILVNIIDPKGSRDIKLLYILFQKHYPLVIGWQLSRRRVYHERTRRRGPIVGSAEGQVHHELRKIESSFALLQRRQHPGQSAQQEVHLSLRLWPSRHCRLQCQGTWPSSSWTRRKSFCCCWISLSLSMLYLIDVLQAIQMCLILKKVKDLLRDRLWRSKKIKDDRYFE